MAILGLGKIKNSNNSYQDESKISVPPPKPEDGWDPNLEDDTFVDDSEVDKAEKALYFLF